MATDTLLGLTGFQRKLACGLVVPEGKIVDPHELDPFIFDKFEAAAALGADALTAALVTEHFEFIPSSRGDLVTAATTYDDEDSEHLAALVTDTLDQQKEQTEKQIDDVFARVDFRRVASPLLATYDVLTGDAFVNNYRKSKKPYKTHPVRIAAMVLYIDEQLIAEGFPITPEEIEADIIQAYGHDSGEETSVVGKHRHKSKLGRYGSFTTVSMMERFEHPLARDVGLGQFHITHFTDMPWMQGGFEDYIDLRVGKHLRAARTKHKDMFDNGRNERKPVTNQAEFDRRAIKEGQYSAAAPFLLERIIEMDSVNAERHVREYEILQSITPDSEQRDMVARLHQKIYG